MTLFAARLAACLCVLALNPPPPGWAGEDRQDRARAAVESGAALPLRTILDAAERDFQGRLLDADLDEEDGTLVYEITLLAPSGQVLKLEYDARSALLRKVKGAALETLRRRPPEPER